MSDAILHVETRHLRGGAERNVNHFCAWQAAQGLRVGLAVGPDSSLDEVPADVEAMTVSGLVRSPHPVRDPQAVRSLRALLEAGRWTVVHTHQSKAGIVGRVAARGRARLVLHTVHMLSFGPGYGRLPSAAFERAERWAAGWTDEMVAVGEELRERYLEAGIGRPDAFRVLRSPIEIDRFALARTWRPEQRQAARDALGLGDSSPLLLAVAALEPRKRLDLIIERLAGQLRDKWVLAIAGEGRQRPALERQVGAAGLEGRVRVLGSRDDVDSLMAAADVFVHAAEAEGVPQVVVQALASGLPVVATDVIGLREVPGAPITIARPDGSDLEARVAAAVDDRPAPIALDRLAPWSRQAVEADIARLHADLGLLP